jgi:hypothetical protein
VSFPAAAFAATHLEAINTLFTDDMLVVSIALIFALGAVVAVHHIQVEDQQLRETEVLSLILSDVAVIIFIFLCASYLCTVNWSDHTSSSSQLLSVPYDGEHIGVLSLSVACSLITHTGTLGIDWSNHTEMLLANCHAVSLFE